MVLRQDSAFSTRPCRRSFSHPNHGCSTHLWSCSDSDVPRILHVVYHCSGQCDLSLLYRVVPGCSKRAHHPISPEINLRKFGWETRNSTSTGHFHLRVNWHYPLCIPRVQRIDQSGNRPISIWSASRHCDNSCHPDHIVPRVILLQQT